MNDLFAPLRTDLLSALIMADAISAKKILLSHQEKASSWEIVEHLVVPVLDDIGQGWEKGIYSLSQVYMSGRICEDLVDLILPPSHPARQTQPKMAIVTLEDYHLLGKRIVYSTLRASGFELENYGQMKVDHLAERVIRDHIEILLVSVLMLPSALKVKQLRQRLDAENFKCKILVGGSPFRFDARLWQEVNADACGETAPQAVAIIRELMETLS